MDKVMKDIGKIEGKISRNECFFLYRLAKKTIEQFGEESVFCEIGSYQGKSTVSIAAALKERSAGILYAIDWHQGSPGFPGYAEGKASSFEKYIKNLKDFSVLDRVRTIKERSEDSFDKVPGKINFLWIDGSHDYENVKADYDNFHKKLVQGGYLLFHDACWTTWQDPFRVISESVIDNQDYNLYALIGNTAVFKKERNRRRRFIRSALRCLCGFVSGEGRPFYKRMLSALFLRIVSFYSICVTR